MLRQGTISVLFGCHSLVHCLMVIRAWHILCGRWPEGWELVCILLHDIGHWGKNYLDDYEEKKKHSNLGARIARRLYGQRGYDLVAGHNPHSGVPRSALFSPDKYSWVIAPTWWLVSNAIFEPKLKRAGHSRVESARMFKRAMAENLRQNWGKTGHDIYLEQWCGQEPEEVAR